MGMCQVNVIGGAQEAGIRRGLNVDAKTAQRVCDSSRHLLVEVKTDLSQSDVALAAPEGDPDAFASSPQ
jgi:hypothetical protein